METDQDENKMRLFELDDNIWK